MKIKEVLTPSFATLLQRQRHHPTELLWRRCLSVRNQFCEAVVRVGFLSWGQMVNAACRYCVGATTRGGVIFWQIDHEGRVHDGKVMYYQPDCHRDKSKAAHPVWVSTLLSRREGLFAGTTNHSPLAVNQISHCFFGLHLLANTNLYSCNSLLKEKTVVAVVEAEKSAFILSELYPDCIWLATGGLGEVQPDKFRPLRGRKVILFPDTDPDGIAFRRWSEAADLVMRSVFWEDSPPIRVSPILELHATADQKSRKIDLVDYVFEASKTSEFSVNSSRIQPLFTPQSASV